MYSTNNEKTKDNTSCDTILVDFINKYFIYCQYRLETTLYNQVEAISIAVELSISHLVEIISL